MSSDTTESPALRFSHKKTIPVARKDSKDKLSYLKFKLVMEDGPEEGREYLLDREKVRVGSAVDNDLIIRNQTVSRHHCEIEATAAGHRVRDLGSTNGIELDGCLIMDAMLHPGAQLMIGDVSLKFQPLEERVEIPLSPDDHFGNMLGHSTQMRALFHLAERVLPHDTTLLITGETGTGKGLLAEEIHLRSPRKDKPFVVVDCSTIPPKLMESELFGHVRGAFTGALYTRPGAIQEAEGGTIFFDEVGELPPPMQTKLLRVLESRQVKPVGSTESTKVDVRIMAATNRNLKLEVEERRFRRDLFFRLCVFELKIPPLQEHREDVPHLARMFLKKLTGGSERRLGDDALRLLVRHDWPGNVRELRNVIERVARLVDDPVIDSETLLSTSVSQITTRPNRSLGNIQSNTPINEAKEQFEKEYLLELLQRHDYNVSAASRTAQIHRQSLHRLLRKHDIRVSEVSGNRPSRVNRFSSLSV